MLYSRHAGPSVVERPSVVDSRKAADSRMTGLCKALMLAFHST